mmetsp:Transcript_32610/g.77357  ORF Transcript_32610/g.77357 Transcript_32610/m.77357 type:complete len:320 (-) Transcript_32610:207-1166(-)
MGTISEDSDEDGHGTSFSFSSSSRARSLSRRFYSMVDAYGKWAPLSSAVVASATLGACLSLTMSGGHVPAGMWMPFISLCNIYAPERYVYVTGLCATALGIAVSVSFGKKNFVSHVEPSYRRLASISMMAGFVACIGLAWQAMIPLQWNIEEVIRGKAAVSVQSMVHQTGALVLFLCGYIHCWIMNFLLWKSATLPSPFYSKAIKLVLAILMLAPFGVATFRHPAAGANVDTDAMSWGGVGQWIAVTALIFYFGSYHIEFVLAAPPRPVSSQLQKRLSGFPSEKDADKDAAGRDEGTERVSGEDETGGEQAMRTPFLKR